MTAMTSTTGNCVAGALVEKPENRPGVEVPFAILLSSG